MPREQVHNLIKRGYLPFPKQILFHVAARACDYAGGPTKVGFGGARGPGKTTTTFAQVTLDDCQRVAGLKCLFIRQTQKAARESFDDLRLRILRHTPHKYNHSSGILNFPNGSRVILGGFANDKDIEKFLGLEYDLIAIEEDTQLSKTKKDKLLTCLRTSKQNWRPRSYHTTNPGGLDHANFKREFIEPFRKNSQSVTRFIPSLSSDNPALNVEYIEHLRNLTGWLRKAWLDGDWDIAAGQFFTNFRYDIHVCKPFAIPANWPVWACLDYGFTHPTAAYLLTKGDGIIYVVAEHFRTKTLPATHADAIIRLFARHNVPLSRLKNFVAGADVFQMRGDTHGKTIADQYRAAGIRLRQAVQDREAGASLILSLLGDAEHDIPPKLQIFETAVNLIEQLPAMVHNPNHPEDVLKVDADEDGLNGDDCFVAGTLIQTLEGEIPIEQLRRGDFVLTRAGYKPIKAIWKSHHETTVLTATFSNHQCLTATPNHQFWVENSGWKCIDALRYGDIMQSLWQPHQNPMLSSLRESNFDDTQTRKNRITENITRQVATIVNAACKHYTLRYGNLFTAQFLRAVTFIIETEIRSTMQLRIWYASLRQNTLRNTLLNLNGWLQPETTLKRFDLSHPLGTNLMRGETGIASTPLRRGKTDNPSKKLVSNAAQHTAHHIRTVLAFAAMPANPNGVEWPAATTLPAYANSVASPSPITNMSQSFFAPDVAPYVRVLEVKETGKADTFAIHVGEQHEYFANGLLVKNCYDSFRYGIASEGGVGVWA